MDQALFSTILLQIKDFKPDVHLQGWGAPPSSGKFLFSCTTLVDVSKQYKQKAPPIAISYLLTGDTVKELPKAVSWCRSVGVDAFVTVALTQSGGVVQHRAMYGLCKI